MSCTLTRVWNIDDYLVVADTVEDALAVMRQYFNGSFTPRHIKAISVTNNGIEKYDALILKEKIK